MPSVDQPRRRAESIPGRQPYRASSPPSAPRLDDEESRPFDYDVENPSANAIDSKPQQPRQDDDMLSLPHINSSSSDIAAPALPAKSALRASRLLASLQQKAASEERPILPHAAPHQVYLSSEEDASSSADDFSDFDELDSDSEQSQQSSESRASHEVTARVVTVVFHGRPSIVELPRRASTSGSTDARRPATGILRTATEPILVRTRSISSSSSPAFQHPPPSSSMLPSGFEKRRPVFLTIDPFATKASDHDEQDSARTPRTPTAMLRKTLSLVRKRSKPILNQTADHPRESFSMLLARMAQVGEETEPDTPREVSPVNRVPASYHDIMRSAKRNAEAPTPRVEATSPLSTNAPKGRFRRGLSISRPRSIRA
ncbi:hypothetical protein TOPH_01662 [Tolypocladium ophioglossoides CBS 100239]|uniref:Uncharacterized protein n=1 Tax=Tolypocladium ophioglossoides (strain CBS 100239) TaxID=1163406 RepID=A0A0L0NI85_TOLOC|nr:hypothetical protein TOPH_01662 [Tolypocladium ophioglossoides CBS 100239]